MKGAKIGRHRQRDYEETHVRLKSNLTIYNRYAELFIVTNSN